MNTVSRRKRFMASVDPPIIGTIRSKGFCSRWSTRPPHMILASFLVYLKKKNSHKTISEDQYQLHIGLYVDDLVFYSSNPAQEVLLQNLLQEHIQVGFMRDVDYFLGNAFTWIHHKDGKIFVHICQSAFTEFSAHWFSVQSANKVPNMTPY